MIYGQSEEQRMVEAIEWNPWEDQLPAAEGERKSPAECDQPQEAPSPTNSQVKLQDNSNFNADLDFLYDEFCASCTSAQGKCAHT